VATYFEKEIKERQFEGETWSHISEEIINQLPQKVYICYDVDGLDPKQCPHRHSRSGGIRIGTTQSSLQKNSGQRQGNHWIRPQ
jgi:arginase family enzyme